MTTATIITHLLMKKIEELSFARVLFTKEYLYLEEYPYE
jgi:hypothetical protein